MNSGGSITHSMIRLSPCTTPSMDKWHHINIQDAVKMGQEIYTASLSSHPDDFHDPTKKKVKTMRVLKRSVKVNHNTGYDLEAVFAHLLIVGQSPVSASSYRTLLLTLCWWMSLNSYIIWSSSCAVCDLVKRMGTHLNNYRGTKPYSLIGMMAMDKHWQIKQS